MPRARHLAAALFFAALTVLSFWGWNPANGVFAPASLVFAVVCTALLSRALRAQDPLLATFIIQYGLAYSFESVRAVYEGTVLVGMASSPWSASLGLLLAAAFVSVVSIVALILRPRRPGVAGPGEVNERPSWWVAAVLFAGCTWAAFKTDSWTYYTGGDVSAQDVGGIRLELLYPPMLTAMLLMVWRTIIARWASPGMAPRSASIVLWIAALTLLGLEFLLQMRRLMITTLILGALIMVQRRASLRRLLRSPTRGLLVAVLGALLVLALTAGSNLWRASAVEHGDTSVSIAARINRMVNRAAVVDGRLSDRLTYLGLNSAAFEYGDSISYRLTAFDILKSSIVTALPGSLFPWKYGADGRSEVVTCEVAFQAIGRFEDLPCTPEAEAVMVGGPLGVVAVGALWGAFLAWLSGLLRRPGFIASLLAFLGFVPMSTLEASALPMVRALRMMAIVGAVLWVGSKMGRIVRGRVRG